MVRFYHDTTRPDSVSKVVDENGEPLVVYHGTRTAGFDVFRYDKFYQTGDDYGEAYYFTADREKANGYAYDARKDPEFKAYQVAKDQAIQRYLNNPTEENKNALKDFKYNGKTLEELLEGNNPVKGSEVKEVFLSLKNPLIEDADGKYYFNVYPEYFDTARNNKNDGMVVNNVIDNPRGNPRPMYVAVAFSPNQIKSATDNVGTFSGENNSILFQAVYHGSPHIIRRPGGDVIRGEELGFNHDKMGTGEGAQAFGWGTYVTQVEAIAKNYAVSLARKAYTVEELKRLDEINRIYAAPSRILISISSKKEFLKNRRTDLKNLDNGKYEAKINKNIKECTRELKLAKKEKDEKNIEFYQDLLDVSISQLDPKHKEFLREEFHKDIDRTLTEIKSLTKEHEAAEKFLDKEFENLQNEIRAINDATKDRPASNIYTLNIPDENQGNYIPWDKPIGIEQFRTIFRQAKEESLDNFVGHLIEGVVMNDDTITTPTGKWLYEQDLRYDLSSKKERSLFLNRAGITGISYPAEYTSGGREDGAQNYVIFNEDDISVTDWHARNMDGIILFQRKQITDEFNRIANDFDEEDFVELGTGQFGKEYTQGEDSPIRAAKFLLAKKSGVVKNAFRDTKFGDVGLAYGDEKNGLFHIIAKHIFELDDFDGITEAVETIEDVLRNGTQKESNTDKNKIIVVNNNYRVVLGKNKQGNYVVTSYDFKRKEGTKRRNPSDITLIDRDAFMKDGTLVPSEAYLNNITSAGNVNILFQSVYHGSGASFDAFDSSYMGTGEGVQAFGYCRKVPCKFASANLLNTPL